MEFYDNLTSKLINSCIPESVRENTCSTKCEVDGDDDMLTAVSQYFKNSKNAYLCVLTGSTLFFSRAFQRRRRWHQIPKI